MELEAAAVDGDLTSIAQIGLSQAVSLKRIADALDEMLGKNPERMGLVDGVMHAIEGGNRGSRT